MGFLYFLLDPNLLKAVEGNKAGVMLCISTTALVLESEASACNDLLVPNMNINVRIPGSVFHSSWLVDGRHQHINTFLVQGMLSPFFSTMALTILSAKPRGMNILVMSILYADAYMAWHSSVWGVTKSTVALAF